MDSPAIIAYITASPDRVLSGDSLCLLVEEGPERQKLLVEIGRALRADIIQLSNGDTMIVTAGH